MTTHFARALSRRRVLSSGLAAMGMTMLAPGLARSAPRSALPGAVTILAFDGTALLAVTPDGLLRHEGDAWTRLDAPAGPSALATHPARPGTILAGWRDGALRRSDDGGQSWTQADAGLPGAAILSIALAAQAPDTIYAAFNMFWGDLTFRPPAPPQGCRWCVAIDTSLPSPLDIATPGHERPLADGSTYVVSSRTVVVLIPRRNE